MDDQRHQNPSLESREECDVPVDTGKALIIHTPVTSVWKNLSMFAPRTPCVNNELVCSIDDSGKYRLGMSSYASVLSKEVWPPLIQEVDSGEVDSPQRVEVSEYLVQSPDESPVHVVDMVDSHIDEGVRHKPSVCGMLGKCFDEQGLEGVSANETLIKCRRK
jgi:hypothetical protein